MKANIKKVSLHIVAALLLLVSACRKDNPADNSDKVDTKKHHSETMDTGKPSDSIIRTNSADGTDSGT